MIYRADNLRMDALLHYADSKGAASKRRVTIRTAEIAAGDLHIGGYCHLQKAPRSFRGRNIIDIGDSETGELLSVPELAARLFTVPLDDIARLITVRRAKRPRTASFDIEFDAEGFTVGWAFPVPEAFRTALDIELTEYRKTVTLPDGRKVIETSEQWTRGAPPALSFGIGDIFYEPAEARRLPWGEALRILRRSVQVIAGRPDTLADDTGIVVEPGEVRFRVQHYSAGKPTTASEHATTQAAFVGFLKRGIL
ncbi:MAG TPA: hypothetical protein VEH84_10630 [Alphaproteobacteria bacterium]|nr:hypothetical protein [Alphaproteobacteria bacterium]